MYCSVAAWNLELQQKTACYEKMVASLPDVGLGEAAAAEMGSLAGSGRCCTSATGIGTERKVSRQRPATYEIDYQRQRPRLSSDDTFLLGNCLFQVPVVSAEQCCFAGTDSRFLAEIVPSLPHTPAQRGDSVC